MTTDNPFPPQDIPPPSPARTVTALRGSWMTRDVKEAIINGAARHGSDGQGTGGMPGYLEMCASNFPKEYMGLLARLVPLQHRDNNQTNAAINIGSVNIHAVPSDHYLTAAEMRAMTTPTIEPEAPHAQQDPEAEAYDGSSSPQQEIRRQGEDSAEGGEGVQQGG